MDWSANKLVNRDSASRAWLALFQQSPVGILLLNNEGIIEDLNPVAESIFGWNRSDFSEVTPPDVLIPESDIDAAAAVLRRLRHDRQPELVCSKARRKDGSLITCEWSFVPLRDQLGNPEGIITFVQDITARVLAEEQLKSSEERFREAFEHSVCGIAIIDEAGYMQKVTQSLMSLLGARKSELLDSRLLDYIEPADIDDFLDQFELLVDKSQQYFSIELRLRHHDDQVIDAFVNASSVHLATSRQRQFVFQIQDVTALKEAQRVALAAKEAAESSAIVTRQKNRELEGTLQLAETLAVESEELAKSKSELIEAIPSILIGVDEEGIVTEWNHAASVALEVSTEDAIRTPIKELGIQWNIETVTDAISRCIEKNEAIRLDDLQILRRSGETGFLGLGINPIRRDKWRNHGVLILGADITERKKIQSQLAQAQKLESIGQLAAGIAHEINTPIQYVGDNLRFLKRTFETLHPLFEALVQAVKTADLAGIAVPELHVVEEILSRSRIGALMSEVEPALAESSEGVDRVANIVRAMKEFSHPGTNHMTSLDLNRAIESTLLVARHEYRYVADVQLDLEPGLPFIPCFVAELNQVLLNIVVNAAYAIREVHKLTEHRGVITVSTRQAGSWAELRITDTGGGIPEAIQTRIFDPFFTTKGVGEGTGQGLAMAHNVITKRHGGTITFESMVGKCTTFIIRLPLEQAMEAAA